MPLTNCSFFLREEFQIETTHDHVFRLMYFRSKKIRDLISLSTYRQTI